MEFFRAYLGCWTRMDRRGSGAAQGFGAGEDRTSASDGKSHFGPSTVRPRTEEGDRKTALQADFEHWSGVGAITKPVNYQARSLRRRNSRKRKFDIAAPLVDRLRRILAYIQRNRSTKGADGSGFAAVNSYGATLPNRSVHGPKPWGESSEMSLSRHRARSTSA